MPDSRFFIVGQALDASAAARLAGADLTRGGDAPVARVCATVESDLSGALVYAETPIETARIAGREFSMCLTNARLVETISAASKGAVAVMPNPRLGFARIAGALYREIAPGMEAGVSKKAIVGAGSQIHPTAVVAAGAQIGMNSIIAAQVYVGPGVVIGASADIGPNASICHALIGARVRILAGVVIGSAGFGFAPGPEGLVRFPQLGRVIIGDDVEIGANSTIDRGAIGDTVLSDGVKIDNLVQIGHNARIGSHTAIAAQAGVAGSSVVGVGVVIGGQVGVADHLHVGDGAQLAGQTGLMRDVPAGERWGGTPGRLARDWLRETAVLARLAAKKRGD